MDSLPRRVQGWRQWSAAGVLRAIGATREMAELPDADKRRLPMRERLRFTPITLLVYSPVPPGYECGTGMSVGLMRTVPPETSTSQIVPRTASVKYAWDVPFFVPKRT